MELEEKIDDIKFAIDDIDNVISRLKDYEEYKAVCSDLECKKSILELDLEALEVEYEELVEQEIQNARNENKELERQYWREVV